MIEDKNNIQGEDDGSLAFLRIPRDESSRSFNCDETTQSKLVNTTFWVVDFIEEVPTRFSKSKGTKGQTLVKIKMSKDDLESNAKKFFTGSSDILYVLKKIKELKAFPRRVTLRSNGNRYYFE
ncbi:MULTISPECIES: hypothetical protein [Bacteroidales]|jgi:hypothetical protein|uniref:hypothetical protein n=1 Tax=Bacteroidales TaxID=171549 RepID=UPI00206EEEC1|nr:hypothetical protein [Paraprevotella clara]DAN17450.1 MAG TPA: hypothetical protein [Caudoviricetes sp.]